MDIEDNLHINDFVIALEDIENIEKQSVGLVVEVTEEHVTIFFIGKKVLIKTEEDKILFLAVKKTGKPYQVKICNICNILKN